MAGSTSDPGLWSYQLSSPTAITMDPYGFIYILDTNNDRVQKWWPGATFGTTVASATMGSAYGLAFDPVGNLYIADSTWHRVIEFGLLCRKFFKLEEIFQRKKTRLFFLVCSTNHDNNSSTS